MIPDFRRQFDAARTPADALSSLGVAIGSWTPTLTAVTPGDLSVSYSTRLGRYYKIGQLIHIWFSITTSAFTYTTATGGLRITGSPFTSTNVQNLYGTCAWSGVTKAGYTQITPRFSTAAPTQISFLASGSGSAVAVLAITDLPTGGSVLLDGHIALIM